MPDRAVTEPPIEMPCETQVYAGETVEITHSPC